MLKCVLAYRLTGFFDEGQEGDTGHYLPDDCLDLPLYFLKRLDTTLAPATNRNIDFLLCPWETEGFFMRMRLVLCARTVVVPLLYHAQH